MSDELYGGQSGQRIQVPVLPNGDWVLPSGVDAVLGAKPDGSAHVLNGDLTVRQGASLTLDGTTLELAAGHTADIETGAVLLGHDGRLIADQISALGSADLRGEDGASAHRRPNVVVLHLGHHVHRCGIARACDPDARLRGDLA